MKSLFLESLRLCGDQIWFGARYIRELWMDIMLLNASLAWTET